MATGQIYGSKQYLDKLEEDSIMGYLMHTYIEVKNNPSVGLPQVVVDWTERATQPTPTNPYGEVLTFPEAFEKHVIPKLPAYAQRQIETTLVDAPKTNLLSAGVRAGYSKNDDRYDTTSYAPGVIMRADPTAGSSENALLEENADLHKQIEVLKAEVEYLKSQDAFAKVANKKKFAIDYDEELPF